MPVPRLSKCRGDGVDEDVALVAPVLESSGGSFLHVGRGSGRIFVF
jgi:hypothetical protein